jgi:uncharacterized membrane protein YdbT with pleckstrin-like domain
MTYPKHLINEGETVALDLHPHWWFFSKHIITGIPLLIALVGVFSIGGDWGSAYVWSAAAIVWAIWLGIKWLDWQFTHFLVTDERVVSRTGVLAKRGVEIPLERISNINFRQGIWERVIGAGDLSIESAGQQGDSTFENVRHPDGVQQEIYRQMQVNVDKTARRTQAPAAAAAAPVGASIPEQIEQLAQLRDQGHITPEDFEAKKAQLLERM